jgi:hypothetical protein
MNDSANEIATPRIVTRMRAGATDLLAEQAGHDHADQRRQRHRRAVA